MLAPAPTPVETRPWPSYDPATAHDVEQGAAKGQQADERERQRDDDLRGEPVS